MADAPAFDPNKPFEPVAAPAFDPTKPFEAAGAPPKPAERPGILSRLASPITDIPAEVSKATSDAVSAVGHYLNPFSAERRAAYERGESGILTTGKGLGSALGVPMAPVIGAFRSVAGHPLAAADEALREGAAKIYGDDKVAPAVGYEGAKTVADKAFMAMAPRGASPVGIRAPAPSPAAPTPNGPLGVTLSEGQEAGALPLIQKEQAALRGQLGEAAEARAKEFAGQQKAQVATAAEDVAKQLDPFGQRIAETPQEAGQVISEGMQSAAAQAKEGVKQAYDVAKAQPGDIHAGAFEGIGQKIKAELSLRDDPIVIDDKLTPFASHAIRDVEDRISKLIIQNRADPFGAPNPENIVGINLKGVDQMRRRLSAFRSDAYASGNAADGRAARAVLEAFDSTVDKAVNSGMFNGDPRAIMAWNDARAAHADYKRTFSAGRNDPTGHVVERILGRSNNPAAIPNDVADFIYGSSGINPSSLNVNVAKRVREVLGDQSPQWSAVKQGLFSRLVESGPGVTDFGPGKIAQRINRFLNADGVELSKTVFSPQERRLIQQFADLHRRLEVPQAGANWSNTATIIAPMLRRISSGIATVVGAVVGHTVAPGLYGAGEAAGMMAANRVGKVVTDARQLRQISTQMPLVSEQLQKWQRTVAAANRTNTPISQRAVDVASANLARSLQSIGLNPAALATPTQAQSQP